MSNTNEIQHIEQLIGIHKENLYVLETQAAKHGIVIPVHIHHGINHEQQQIKVLSRLLEAYKHTKVISESINTVDSVNSQITEVLLDSVKIQSSLVDTMFTLLYQLGEADHQLEILAYSENISLKIRFTLAIILAVFFVWALFLVFVTMSIFIKSLISLLLCICVLAVIWQLRREYYGYILYRYRPRDKPAFINAKEEKDQETGFFGDFRGIAGREIEKAYIRSTTAIPKESETEK